MDIFNAFYFSTISSTVDIFKIIAYQISGSRLCWGATCQE
jgi:hypothetical protein